MIRVVDNVRYRTFTTVRATWHVGTREGNVTIVE